MENEKNVDALAEALKEHNERLREFERRYMIYAHLNNEMAWLGAKDVSSAEFDKSEIGLRVWKTFARSDDSLIDWATDLVRWDENYKRWRSLIDVTRYNLEHPTETTYGFSHVFACDQERARMLLAKYQREVK